MDINSRATFLKPPEKSWKICYDEISGKKANSETTSENDTKRPSTYQRPTAK